MYVVVQHEVSDRAKFWGMAEQGANALPSHLKLHHCFPAPDGSRAVCVWEAQSMESLQRFFDDSGFNQTSRNTFFGVENKEGVALPSSVQQL